LSGKRRVRILFLPRLPGDRPLRCLTAFINPSCGIYQFAVRHSAAPIGRPSSGFCRGWRSTSGSFLNFRASTSVTQLAGEQQFTRLSPGCGRCQQPGSMIDGYVRGGQSKTSAGLRLRLWDGVFSVSPTARISACARAWCQLLPHQAMPAVVYHRLAAEDRSGEGALRCRRRPHVRLEVPIRRSPPRVGHQQRSISASALRFSDGGSATLAGSVGC